LVTLMSDDKLEETVQSMTVRETADYLGVGVHDVHYLIETGRLRVEGRYKTDPTTKGPAPYMLYRSSVEQHKVGESSETDGLELPEKATFREAMAVTGLSRHILQKGVDSGAIQVVSENPKRLARQSVLDYAATVKAQAGRPIRLAGYPHLTIVSFIWRHHGQITRAALEKTLEEIFEGGVKVEITDEQAREGSRIRSVAIVRSRDMIPARTILYKLKNRAQAWLSDARVQWQSTQAWNEEPPQDGKEGEGDGEG
jgi:hypothetical protein